MDTTSFLSLTPSPLDKRKDSETDTRSIGHHSPSLGQSQVQTVNGPLTIPHKILLWPVVKQALFNAGLGVVDDLHHVLKEGTLWFTRRELDPLSMKAPDWPVPEHIEMESLNLKWMLACSEAYFDTFNTLFPVLARQSFTNGMLHYVIRNGFPEGEPATVVALHVFALGEVAVQGSSGQPIHTADQETISGVRGGSYQHPPGLSLFDEARRQQALLSPRHLMKKVQTLLLQAFYFDSSCRYVDFWSSMATAATICQLLIKTGVDWSSPRGDLIKRAYWVCVFAEDLFHIDMDLPSTGLSSMQDDVPFPHFFEMQDLESLLGHSHKENVFLRFLAMLTLRRIIVRIHEVLQKFSG